MEVSAADQRSHTVLEKPSRQPSIGDLEQQSPNRSNPSRNCRQQLPECRRAPQIPTGLQECPQQPGQISFFGYNQVPAKRVLFSWSRVAPPGPAWRQHQRGLNQVEPFPRRRNPGVWDSGRNRSGFDRKTGGRSLIICTLKRGNERFMARIISQERTPCP